MIKVLEARISNSLIKQADKAGLVFIPVKKPGDIGRNKFSLETQHRFSSSRLFVYSRFAAFPPYKWTCYRRVCAKFTFAPERKVVKRTEGEISSVIVEPTEPPVSAPFPNRADFQRKLNRWICGATVRSVCIRVFLKSLADSGNRFLFVRVDTARV